MKKKNTNSGCVPMPACVADDELTKKNSGLEPMTSRRK